MSTRNLRSVAALCLALVSLTSGCSSSEDSGRPYTPRTRTYYIAADEVDWDYAPSGMDRLMGMPFDADALVFVEPGPERIGRVYKKALYREYTDETFTQLKEIPAAWQHRGALGPIIRGVVGDTIEVFFKNNSTDYSYAIHPHGVLYKKDSEGAPYNDGTTGADRADDDVAPGGTHKYVWQVEERSGPGPLDPSSVAWLYHSHADEPADTNAGLIGLIIITDDEKVGDADLATPADVDSEVALLFTVFDENISWYLQDNIQEKITANGGDPATIDPGNEDFIESNLMHNINGFVYGNLPVPQLALGGRTRWYFTAMGTEVDIHTPHFHANTLDWHGNMVDTVEVFPASTTQADMVTDNPGIWMFHCHVNDHIYAGMGGRYEVVAAP
ncbi:MAG: multicopper oxidase domain-containing protein [Deltaproteobacteria bacterium]|nr:multicopper oxidase domain-containing protein [Deltaproteobacteria bacterium]